MIWLGVQGRRKLAELDERLAKAERTQQALEIEWSNVLDKLNHITGRLAKRQKKMELRDEPTIEYDDEERKHRFRLGLEDE